jgi:ketosteroid isomerase-like protein
MSEFKRSEKEVREVMGRFVETSRRAEDTGDWAALADFFAEDAEYRYTMGSHGMRVARGREEVRRLVMQRDMMGFDGWRFPYDTVAVDGAEVITRWWNEAPAKHEDGSPYRIIGNSNIRLNDALEIVDMHDNFDLDALLAMVRKLNQLGKTKIHIPQAAEAEEL